MHANAALTPRARLKLGRLVVIDHVTVADAARRFQCSYATAKRWVSRFRELHEAGVVVTPEHLADRSSRAEDLTEQDPAAAGPQDRPRAVEAPRRAGRDRRDRRRAGLDGARRAAALRHQ